MPGAPSPNSSMALPGDQNCPCGWPPGTAGGCCRGCCCAICAGPHDTWCSCPSDRVLTHTPSLQSALRHLRPLGCQITDRSTARRVHCAFGSSLPKLQPIPSMPPPPPPPPSSPPPPEHGPPTPLRPQVWSAGRLALVAALHPAPGHGPQGAVSQRYAGPWHMDGPRVVPGPVRHGVYPAVAPPVPLRLGALEELSPPPPLKA